MACIRVMRRLGRETKGGRVRFKRRREGEREGVGMSRRREVGERRGWVEPEWLLVKGLFIF